VFLLSVLKYQLSCRILFDIEDRHGYLRRVAVLPKPWAIMVGSHQASCFLSERVTRALVLGQPPKELLLAPFFSLSLRGHCLLATQEEDLQTQTILSALPTELIAYFTHFWDKLAVKLDDRQKTLVVAVALINTGATMSDPEKQYLKMAKALIKSKEPISPGCNELKTVYSLANFSSVSFDVYLKVLLKGLADQGEIIAYQQAANRLVCLLQTS